MTRSEAAVLDAQGAQAARRTTVLLAEVRGAVQARPYLEALRLAAELSGGRVLNDRNRALLALFPTPDAAAVAATRMHAYADTLPSGPGRPAVGVAFHAGPVAQRNEEIYGDTVNLALELVAHTKGGQILTSHDTACDLNPAIQDAVRPAPHLRLKGKDGELMLGELLWRDSTSRIVSLQAQSAGPRPELRLSCGGKTLLRRREGDSITLGRDADCALSLEGGSVSRRHCTILQRGAGFVLRDHSRNGTFVTLRGQAEVCVEEAELALAGRGRISLGQPAQTAPRVVAFIVE